MTADKNLLHVEIYVAADDGSNTGVLVNTLDVSPDNIRFTPGGGILRDRLPLREAVHAALAKRYGVVMGCSFALVIDGNKLNDCYIDGTGGDSWFVCLGNP